MDSGSITPQEVVGFITANLIVLAALYFHSGHHRSV